MPKKSRADYEALAREELLNLNALLAPIQSGVRLTEEPHCYVLHLVSLRYNDQDARTDAALVILFTCILFAVAFAAVLRSLLGS